MFCWREAAVVRTRDVFLAEGGGDGDGSAGWEAAELRSGIILMAVEVNGGDVVWEAVIVCNRHVLLAEDVDGIGGGGAVWRATIIISNIVVWAKKGGGGGGVCKVANSGNIIL